MIIHFFSGVGLWAQYSEGGHALDEWEIVTSDYRIEQTRDGSIIRIHFTSPRSERNLPTTCSDCVESSGFLHFDPGRVRRREDQVPRGRPTGQLALPVPGIRILDQLRGRHLLRLTRISGQIEGLPDPAMESAPAFLECSCIRHCWLKA